MSAIQECPQPREASISDSSLYIRMCLESSCRGLALLNSTFLQDAAFHDAMCAAAETIYASSGRINITGVGKSGHIGRKLAATFSSTGTKAYFVHATEANHGDLGMIGDEDILIALSWSGETTELAGVIDYAARFNIKTIAMTAGAHSTLAQHADIPVILPRAPEACPHGLAPTTSALVQMAAGDALAISVLQMRGFTAQDFRAFHPGGKLGAQLLLVHELARKGRDIPLVRTGALLSSTIIEMTSKGIGLVGVCDDDGKLLGVVSDGDLRRNMAPDLLEKRVDDIMSPNPKIVRADILAAEALERMQANKINALLLVENGRPIGAVHVMDLLRAGVA